MVNNTRHFVLQEVDKLRIPQTLTSSESSNMCKEDEVREDEDEKSSINNDGTDVSVASKNKQKKNKSF